MDFDEYFKALTGYSPFPWQGQLFKRFMQGEIPSSCDLPTGLGKTSIMAIWLIALAKEAKVPRRLVYVVNRRTVVDQATREAERLRENLERAGLTAPLKRLCVVDCDMPLAISTLRGQFADNGQWCANPARPAIICGTVDMIGSRLLFNGYRIGFKSRPLHAGLLGQDALLVHDEAHLEPAFQKLIEAIKRQQDQGERTGQLPWPKLHVMQLTATMRNAEDSAQGDSLCVLTDEERNPPDTSPNPPLEPIHHVWRRLKAVKTLALHQAGNGNNAVAKKIAELATGYKDSNAAVLVFVRTLDAVNTVQKELSKTKRRVVLLTGTMRGKERDELVETPEFKRFLGTAESSETVYLVCTSAGEVGIDISADHLVCDLSTFESMAQRFGRVNRFGDRNDTRIDAVYPEAFDKKDKLIPARQATLNLLRQLQGDASCMAIGRLMQKEDCTAAFSPEPTILPVTDILFDAWAMTTIRDKMPGRPPVEPYLHGIAEWEPPQTYVAWRQEVEIVTGELLDKYPPADLLEDYPLKPHELLRDRSERVFKQLKALSKNHPDKPVWVIDDRGIVEHPATIEELLDQGQAAIENCTLLLPPSAGGLSGGMLDKTSEHADDVADIENLETERRIRIWSDDEQYEEKTAAMRLVRSIEMPSAEDDEAEPRRWEWYKQKPLEDTRTAQKPVTLKVHHSDVENRARRIVKALSLPEDIAAAVVLAAKLHDVGKQRRQFQTTLGNRDTGPLAKSGGRGARMGEPFRHEFASLLDAANDPQAKELSPQMQDLVLHLIAAHHGRARPHFPEDEAYDPERPATRAEAEAVETLRRFGRLQRRYGRWGLAYLESLLRAADWAASAEPSQFVNFTQEKSP